MNMPSRQTQSGAGDSKSRVRGQGGVTQSRAYRMTLEEAQAAPEVVAGMLRLNGYAMYTLIDLGATHSFLAYECMKVLNMQPRKLKEEMIIWTTLGNSEYRLSYSRSSNRGRRD